METSRKLCIVCLADMCDFTRKLAHNYMYRRLWAPFSLLQLVYAHTCLTGYLWSQPRSVQVVIVDLFTGNLLQTSNSCLGVEGKKE